MVAPVAEWVAGASPAHRHGAGDRPLAVVLDGLRAT
jgi:hypothetical protein